MKILVDTSVIVEVDRGNQEVISLLKSIVEKDIQMVISTVTVSEILTGSYLTKDVRRSVLTGKEILNQFIWVDVNGEVAEKTAQILAYLISKKLDIEYQDAVIAATFFTSYCDYLITLNKKDFVVVPNIDKKAFNPTELKKFLKI